MTLYLTADLTVEELEKAYAVGVTGVKYYPHGLTTNSQHGIHGFNAVYPVLEAMQRLGMVLNIHGEVMTDIDQDICVMNAEIHFLHQLQKLHADFPQLKIVLEHATTRAAVECVAELGPTVAATLTVHHLDLIVDDWAGRPHHFCKPVAKYPSDRQALRRVISEGNPKFFLGSDSAPHLRHRKEAAECCAGVYTSEYLMPVLAHILDSFGAIDKLRAFSHDIGYAFYKDIIAHALKHSSLEQATAFASNCQITLQAAPMKIPDSISVEGCADELVPFYAGRTVRFSLKR
eukprot:Partr_v1_DN25734_c0_g1_i4_m74696 putative K01465 dihydroorotase EC 3.5.2.3